MKLSVGTNISGVGLTRTGHRAVRIACVGLLSRARTAGLAVTGSSQRRRRPSHLVGCQPGQSSRPGPRGSDGLGRRVEQLRHGRQLLYREHRTAERDQLRQLGRRLRPRQRRRAGDRLSVRGRACERRPHDTFSFDASAASNAGRAGHDHPKRGWKWIPASVTGTASLPFVSTWTARRSSAVDHAADRRSDCLLIRRASTMRCR